MLKKEQLLFSIDILSLSGGRQFRLHLRHFFLSRDFARLTHEADIISARQALFLERNQDVFLDRLGVGEGIVKIKGRLPPTHVQFQEIHVQPGAIKDEDLKS